MILFNVNALCILTFWMYAKLPWVKSSKISVLEASNTVAFLVIIPIKEVALTTNICDILSKRNNASDFKLSAKISR